MSITLNKITPCLWFDSEAEEAARFYASIFENSRIGRIARYGKEGFEVHGRPEGSVMVVEFELEGRSFIGLNGGPHFKFTEAVSFQILCDTQDEVDYYWDKLAENGGGTSQQCGWLKDRFGLSWQVVPKRLTEMLQDKDTEKAGRVMSAVMQMVKPDIAAAERAFGAAPGKS